MAEIRVVTPAVGRRVITGGGRVAGVIGGLVLTALFLFLAAGAGRDGWTVLKMPSALFFHRRAMLPGFDAAPVILGALIHLAVSIFWGIAFAVVVFGMSRPATVVLGALWGIVVFAAMYFIVLPLVMSAHHLPSARSLAAPIFEHMLFGLPFAVAFLPFHPHPPEHLPSRPHP